MIRTAQPPHAIPAALSQAARRIREDGIPMLLRQRHEAVAVREPALQAPAQLLARLRRPRPHGFLATAGIVFAQPAKHPGPVGLLQPVHRG